MINYLAESGFAKSLVTDKVETDGDPSKVM